jgi:hypothetical protein
MTCQTCSAIVGSSFFVLLNFGNDPLEVAADYFRNPSRRRVGLKLRFEPALTGRDRRALSAICLETRWRLTMIGSPARRVLNEICATPQRDERIQ